jgi:LmbE family N-acetylglucosaminyl deacetylase
VILSLSRTDRILIFAPHPDDESLAAGGLIQRAYATGCAVRVVFATDGENNPWPQRFIERRWRISTSDRTRWGILRRREAQAAIACLGGSESTACFLGFPDQGLTQILVRSRDALLARITAQILECRPTIILLPAAQDAHPDHSALHVLVRFALNLIDGNDAHLLEYFVHRPAQSTLWPPVTLTLTPDEVALKRAAILRHESQIVLSYRRFIAFAARHETFRTGGEVDDWSEAHPIRFAELANSALRILFKPPLFPGAKLLIATQWLPRGFSCWSLRLPATSRLIHLRDELAGHVVAHGTIRRSSFLADVRIPLETSLPLRCAFIKLRVPSFSRNDSGWRGVTLSASSDRSNEITNDYADLHEGVLDAYRVSAGAVEHGTGALIQPKFRIADSSLPR